MWEQPKANQNSIQEEIESTMNSRNACYHSVLKLLSSSFLSKNKKIKADSTRALKTRRLRRPTKRVATPTEFSNEEIYKNSRSNLDERC